MSFQSDRNLLVGLMGLQLGFISQEQLVASLLAWSESKERPIEDIWLSMEVVDGKTHGLISALVEERLAKNPELKVSMVRAADLDALQTELEIATDQDLQASLATLVPQTQAPNPHANDEQATIGELAHAATPPAMEAENRSIQGLEHTSAHRESTSYELKELHARGGLGEVYRAQDNGLNREVALKQMRDSLADDLSAQNRFLLEAEVTGRLEHPGVVPVYGIGKDPRGRPYYAMRFIRGSSLADAVKSLHQSSNPLYSGTIPLELRKLLDRFIDVCQTVEYAHSRGVLHRDIKPDNIMLGPYGETLLVDWGLAKAAGRELMSETGGEATLEPVSGSSTAPTIMGSVIGTPAFMSPEQARGELNQIGPASDVFSLGATLFFILTGRIAALADDQQSEANLQTILYRVSQGDTPALSRYQNRIPKALEAICLKAMEKQAVDRYANAHDLAEDLQRFLADEPVTAYRDSFGTRCMRWVRRHQTLAASAVSMVFLSLVGLGIFFSILNAKQEELEKTNVGLRIAENDAREAADRAESRRLEAEQARIETEIALQDAEQARANAMQFSVFLQDHILATAKPVGRGGLGRDVSVLEALAAAEEKVEEIFSDTPSAEVSVRNGLATTWHSLGMLDRAKQNAERALELAKVLNFDNDEDIHIEGSYASILRDLGEYEKSIDVGLRVVKRFQDKYGRDDAYTITALNNLGITYTRAGKLAEARELYEEVYESVRAQNGLSIPENFPLQTNYAEVLRYGSEEDRAQALAIMERLYGLQQEALGELDPDTMFSVNNLATFYSEEGEGERAIQLIRELLERMEEVLGEDHPQRLITLANLGDSLLKLGRQDEGLQVLQDAWGRSKRKLTELHPDTLNTLDLYANGLIEAGNVEEGLPLLEEVVAGRRETLGVGSLDTLTAMNNLANAYQEQGRLEEAAELQAEVVAEGRIAMGSNHPNFLIWLDNLAYMKMNLGDLEEAEGLLRESMETLRAEKGEASFQTWQAMQNLATVQNLQGRYSQAIETLQSSLRGMQAAGLSPTSASILEVKTLMAAVYRDSGQLEEANQRLEQVIEAMHKLEAEVAQEQRMQLRGALAELATNELKLGNYASAEQHARESLEIAADLIPDDWRTANVKSVLGAALSRQERWDEARSLLEEGFAGIEPLQNVLPERIVVAAIDRLIFFFEQIEEPEEAQAWHKRKESYLELRPQ